MKRLFLLLLLFTVVQDSFAQKKNITVKGYAFYTVQQPGNIPVDENNIPLKTAVQKEHIIYLISNGPQPLIRKVLYNNVEADMELLKTKSGSLLAGKAMDDKTVIITAKKSEKIWVYKVSEKTNALPEQVSEIIIEGSSGKVFRLRLTGEKELQGAAMY